MNSLSRMLCSSDRILYTKAIMPNVTVTNTSNEKVFIRDFYLTLNPGASASFFRTSLDLMRSFGLHELIVAGKVSCEFTYKGNEKKLNLDDLLG